MILPLMLCLMARYQYLQYFMLPKHLRFDQEVSACVPSSTSQTHMLGRLKDFKDHFKAATIEPVISDQTPMQGQGKLATLGSK